MLRTPHIDGIAASGTRIQTGFYVASPVCMPNRASLPQATMQFTPGLRYNGNYLSWRANTFVDVLRAGGYRTAHIGKSHVQPMTNAPPYPRVDARCRLGAGRGSVEGATGAFIRKKSRIAFTATIHAGALGKAMAR